ncbi:DUF4177 domain-containing protein [Tabrizicola piscis]|uniref:DUF4177 domain-containing protein n=1 Tax=Tabrizicola piscis TaxID=2494374 RepID=A0A3S8UAI6_9RHOB|nr:DUF4177 domain-containing protein [Tabrizicola piscis]AZL60614.1 DUF4177 domain-containing protein [Tabrizicola piscis]
MQRFEYKVIPAPKRGEKARGVKTTEDRFALALTNLMNDLGAEGWEYVRADALPCDERVGLTGTKTTFQNVLVFRRVLGAVEAAERPPLRLLLQEPAAAPTPRLGPAETPLSATAPAVGPVKPNLAAE